MPKMTHLAELVEHLEMILEKHGDMAIRIDTSLISSLTFCDIQSIGIEETETGKPQCIIEIWAPLYGDEYGN